MAKFIFKLENLLSVKSKLEEQAKTEYGLEMSILREEEEKLEQLKNKKEEIQLQLKQEMVRYLNILRIKELENGVENLKYNINLQKIVVANQQMRVDRAREKLDEAMKERKTYEKLKENAFEVFKQEINAEEQKEVDELVSFRFSNQEERED